MDLDYSLRQGRKYEQKFAAFFEEWMWEFDADTRKNLSHAGGIRRSDPCHPCHWLQGTKEMFDPGNYIYSQCMKAVLRRPDAYGWSDETWGDIAEGILAVASGEYKIDVSTVAEKAKVEVCAVAMFVETASRHMYTVMSYFPGIKPATCGNTWPVYFTASLAEMV